MWHINQYLNKNDQIPILCVEDSVQHFHRQRQVGADMKYERPSQSRFEKNVIAGALIAGWGWESPAIKTSGCGKQESPSRKSKPARTHKQHHENG